MVQLLVRGSAPGSFKGGVLLLKNLVAEVLGVYVWERINTALRKEGLDSGI